MAHLEHRNRVAEQRKAAMRGQCLPDDDLHDQDIKETSLLIWKADVGLTDAAVIRGIRCHYAFATSKPVTYICTRRPDFARARNARLIMSNVLPCPEDMGKKIHQPYCIWYPDFASEDTYRKLAQHYPSMRYQVGRACAAAGFVSLYNELNLLPDVSVAEEARESGTDGGRIIYETIMAAPLRFAVMDDYTLSVNLENPCCPAFLTADTDVRWRLEHRRSPAALEWTTNPDQGPCIEEDRRVGEESVKPADSRRHLTHDEVQLLYNPLPPDLPTMKKTLLIQMAAYEGNVDRYVSLARPLPMTRIEQLCVIRGIYHHTTFARFWAAEIERKSPRVQRLQDPTVPKSFLTGIRRAISARRIMVNDTQEFDSGWNPDAPKPFMIWWPLRPREVTLVALLELAPEMKRIVAIASVVCDYEALYKKANIGYDEHLWYASKNSRNPFYRRDLEAKAAASGVDLEYVHPSGHDEDAYCLQWDLEPTDIFIFSKLQDTLEASPHGYGEEEGPYDSGNPLTSPVDRHIWATPEILLKLEHFCNGMGYVPTAPLNGLTLPKGN